MTAAPTESRKSPIALVVGASGGIGRAICTAFGQAGWRVAVHYHLDEAQARKTLSLVASCGSDGVLCRADVRDAEQVGAMIDELDRKGWFPYTMVCAAGIAASRMVLRQPQEEWDDVLTTNLTGTFHCLRAAAAGMVARKGGSIIVLGSYAGSRGTAGQGAYAASKAGLLGLVRTAAREWGGDNVRVHLVLPGWHRTSLSGDAMPEDDGFLDHLLGRPPSTGEVAATVLHLATLAGASGNQWNCDSRLL